MANNREDFDEDTSLDPEDVNSGPTRLTPEQLAADESPSSKPARRSASPPSGDSSLPASLPDPNDVIPVPPAMSAAEVDKRGEVVEELRDIKDDAVKEPKRDDESGMR